MFQYILVFNKLILHNSAKNILNDLQKTQINGNETPMN